MAPTAAEENGFFESILGWLSKDANSFGSDSKSNDERTGASNFDKVEQYSDGIREKLGDNSQWVQENVVDYADRVIQTEVEVGIGVAAGFSNGPIGGDIGIKPVYLVFDEHGEMYVKSDIGGSIGLEDLLNTNTKSSI